MIWFNHNNYGIFRFKQSYDSLQSCIFEFSWPNFTPRKNFSPLSFSCLFLGLKFCLIRSVVSSCDVSQVHVYIFKNSSFVIFNIISNNIWVRKKTIFNKISLIFFFLYGLQISSPCSTWLEWETLTGNTWVDRVWVRVQFRWWFLSSCWRWHRNFSRPPSPTPSSSPHQS